MLPFKDNTDKGAFANSAALGDIFPRKAQSLQKSVQSQRAYIAANHLAAADEEIKPDVIHSRGVVQNGVAVSLAALSAIACQIGSLFLLNGVVALINVIEFFRYHNICLFIGFGGDLPPQIRDKLLTLLLCFCRSALYRHGGAGRAFAGKGHHQSSCCHHCQKQEEKQGSVTQFSIKTKGI